jgi:carbon-monoxide dehydrogenase medium subunit
VRITRRFDLYVPKDPDDLLEYLDVHQVGVKLIANGSDLINRIQRRQVNPKVLVDLSGLSQYKFVRKDGGMIRIGALTTISEMIESPVLNSCHDVFSEVADKFGGPAIINVATLGGNICASSSSEDLIPVLLVLDANVCLRSKHGDRVLRLEEFLKGKRITDLRPNEVLVEAQFNELDGHSTCAFEKIGMRNSLIIAFVSAAVFLKLGRSGVVDDVRIAFNRVTGKIPERARKTEENLRGKILSANAMEDSIRVVREELQLTSDFRVSEEYRREVACVLYKRALSRCAQKLGEKSIV